MKLKKNLFLFLFLFILFTVIEAKRKPRCSICKKSGVNMIGYNKLTHISLKKHKRNKNKLAKKIRCSICKKTGYNRRTHPKHRKNYK